jgi:hypothetical protein
MGRDWDAPWREIDTEEEEVVDDSLPKTAMERRNFQEWAAKWLALAFRALKPGGVIKIFGGCYDAQTEVLTRRGWVHFPEVREDDFFASLRPEDSKIEWLPPVEIVQQPHMGEMVRYKTNRIDLLVTNNHKMFVAPAVPVNSKFQLLRADEHSETIRMTKTSAGRMDLNLSDAFVLPPGEQSIGPGGMRDFPASVIPWENWLPFFGLWLAEGSASFTEKSETRTGNGYTVKLSHLTISNLEELKVLLAPWFKVNVYSDLGCAVINNKQLYTYLQQFGKAWEKFVPDEVKALPPQHLRLLLDWYSRGDGDARHRLYTTSPRLRDDWQEIALYAGWAADWVVEKEKKTTPKINGREIHSRRPAYRVSLLKTQTKPLVLPTKQGKKPRTFIPAAEWGGQMVYCVELSHNHTLYVRRNGKAVWCGNTRMFHRMGAAMVQVGFEIKKLEAWVYGSGFPKSLDVSKALDKSVGAKRQILATRKGRVSSGTGCYNWNNPNSTGDQSQVPITDPVTEAAKKFNGYGTTLKPAWEPFLVGRKPC